MSDDEPATDKFEFEKQLPIGEGTKKFWDEDAAYEFIEQRVWPDVRFAPTVVAWTR